ncbi:MAG: Hsp20 family protein [Candidatus Omnitrophica bacterium]|nr:Hsp20 family protein [Candidatus Omnitrophota bacterium]
MSSNGIYHVGTQRRCGMTNASYEDMVIIPVVNIKENGKAVTIEAEMTGLSKEDISLDLQGDELTLKGEKSDCQVPKGYIAVYRERCPFKYSRTFILGDEVQREGITAKYENGILRVIIPKVEKEHPRKIEITD